MATDSSKHSTGENREENPGEDDALKRARVAMERSGGVDVAEAAAEEGMFASLQRDLAQEDNGWLSGLRGQSTAVRLGLLLGALSVLVASRLWSMASVGHVEMTPRVTASLVALSLLMGALAVLGLRPLHRPSLSWRAEMAAVFGSLLCVFVLSLWPSFSAVGVEHVGAALGAEHAGGSEAWRCFAMGSMVAAVVYAAVRFVHRGTWIGGLFAALLAGVAANLVLTTHCPSAAAGHTLLGHFLVMAVAGAAYVLASRLTES